MNIKVTIVNAFKDGDQGGNPAGVVLNADALTSTQKLEIARKVGLSETAFVSDSDSADFKLDFFTPQRQIAHCGHATIATFSLLSQSGLVSNPNTSKETIDGNRNIEVQGDFAFMEQLAPRYQEFADDISMLCESLGIDRDCLTSTPMIVNTGNSFLVAGVRSISDLESIKPDSGIIESISEKYDLIGFYIYTLETNQADRDASTRMFAPRYGIEEESATGMAAGPLACFLRDRMQMHKDMFLIEQGYSMKPESPSCIRVELFADSNGVTGLKAGGLGEVSRHLEVSI